MRYDYAVVIGRFQIFHKGHWSLINKALQLAPKVIVLVGSAGKRRSLKNPFYWYERARMIEGAFPTRVIATPVTDYAPDDTVWARDCSYAFNAIARSYHPDHKMSVVLVGHAKDSSSYYLRLFPQWTFHDPGSFGKLSSTPIREAYFTLSWPTFERKYRAKLTKSTREFLRDFRTSSAYRTLKRRASDLHKSRRARANRREA